MCVGAEGGLTIIGSRKIQNRGASSIAKSNIVELTVVTVCQITLEQFKC